MTIRTFTTKSGTTFEWEETPAVLKVVKEGGFTSYNTATDSDIE